LSFEPSDRLRSDYRHTLFDIDDRVLMMNKDTIDKPKPKRKITYKQKKFVEKYVELGGNATQAALAAFDIKDNNLVTAGGVGYEYLNKPQVRELLESYAVPIVEHVRTLATNARSEYVQLEASRDILDRAGYKAVERVENVSINVTLSGTLASKRQIDTGNSVTP
jgi:Terminase small subunit